MAFNDIDFCLKVRALGYLVVYNPYVELYHYESKSRGLEDTPEKLARFHREIEILERRWPDIMKNGDPYYNPNLTLGQPGLFAETDLRRDGEKIYEDTMERETMGDVVPDGSVPAPGDLGGDPAL